MRSSKVLKPHRFVGIILFSFAFSFPFSPFIPRAWSESADSTTLQGAAETDALPVTIVPIGMRRGGTEYHVSCSQVSDCNAGIQKLCKRDYYPTAWMSQTSFDFACNTDRPPKRTPIRVVIRHECKLMFYGPDFIDFDSHGKPIKTKRRPKSDYVLWDPARAISMAYNDPRTSITMYVESDGRHIAATDAQGNLLWVRNPWEEARVFCPYRTPRPVVASLKMVELNDVVRSKLALRGAHLEHTFIELSFDSSQYGVLDESTGDFFPLGQNSLYADIGG